MPASDGPAVADVQKLLQVAETHFAAGTAVDLRVAAYALVDYYKCMIDILAMKTGRLWLLNLGIDRKLTNLEAFYPELEPSFSILKRVDKVRNKVAHTDFEAPDIDDIRAGLAFAPNFAAATTMSITLHLSRVGTVDELVAAIELLEFEVDGVAELYAGRFTDEEGVGRLRSRLAAYRDLASSLASESAIPLESMVNLVQGDMLIVSDIRKRAEGEAEEVAMEARYEAWKDAHGG